MAAEQILADPSVTGTERLRCGSNDLCWFYPFSPVHAGCMYVVCARLHECASASLMTSSQGDILKLFVTPNQQTEAEDLL